MSILDGYLIVLDIILALWVMALYSWRFRVRLHNESVASAEYCRGYDAGRVATLEIYKRADPQPMDNLVPPGTVMEYPPGGLHLAEVVVKNAKAIEILRQRLDENGVLYKRIDRLRERMHAMENMKDTVGALVNKVSGLGSDHRRMDGELRACQAAITEKSPTPSHKGSAWQVFSPGTMVSDKEGQWLTILSYRVLENKIHVAVQYESTKAMLWKDINDMDGWRPRNCNIDPPHMVTITLPNLS